MPQSRALRAATAPVPPYPLSRNSPNAKTTRQVLAVRKPISLQDNCLKRMGFGRAAKSARQRTHPSRILRCEALETRAMLSVYYVDSAAGNDSWSGLAGAFVSGATGPWKTITKVNSAAFAAGDSILFKRGDTWREELVCDSGTSSGRITYGDYGDPMAPSRRFWAPRSETLLRTGPTSAATSGRRLPRLTR